MTDKKQEAKTSLGKPLTQLVVFEKGKGRRASTIARRLLEETFGPTLGSWWKEAKAGRTQWSELVYRHDYQVLARVAYTSDTLWIVEGQLASIGGQGDQSSKRNYVDSGFWTLEVHRPLQWNQPIYVWTQNLEGQPERWKAAKEAREC